MGADRSKGQAFGQARTGWPQQTKQRPKRRGDAKCQCSVFRVVKLLLVQQGANEQVGYAVHGDGLLLGQIAGCANDWQRVYCACISRHRRVVCHIDNRTATEWSWFAGSYASFVQVAKVAKVAKVDLSVCAGNGLGPMGDDNARELQLRQRL